MAPRVAIVVTARAPHGRVTAAQGPARVGVVEVRLTAARPPHERSVAPDVLDVAMTALLAAVRAPVEACVRMYASPEVGVAPEARGLVDAPARRVAVVAVLVPFERRVRPRQRARRQELCSDAARRGDDADRGERRHRAPRDPLHSDQIHR